MYVYEENLPPIKYVSARDRRLSLCDRAADGGIALHCIGGMALDNPDIKWLLKRGYLKLERHGPKPRSRITYAVITETGEKWRNHQASDQSDTNLCQDSET